MKRIISGSLWTILIYFLGCALVGAIAGGIEGSQFSDNPESARAFGQNAGMVIVSKYRGYIAICALLLGIVCTWFGLLPGTKVRKNS